MWQELTGVYRDESLAMVIIMRMDINQSWWRWKPHVNLTAHQEKTCRIWMIMAMGIEAKLTACRSFPCYPMQLHPFILPVAHEPSSHQKVSNFFQFALSPHLFFYTLFSRQNCSHTFCDAHHMNFSFVSIDCVWCDFNDVDERMECGEKIPCCFLLNSH